MVASAGPPDGRPWQSYGRYFVHLARHSGGQWSIVLQKTAQRCLLVLMDLHSGEWGGAH